MGKNKRNQFFDKKKIRISTFFLFNPVISMNGIKAHARRNSDDFELLFVPREKDVLTNLDLMKNEIFIDVGANVGYYTLRSATLYPQNKIISIEAHPDTFKALKKNVVEINHFGNVVLVNKAAYHSKDQIQLFQHGGWSGLSSIYRREDRISNQTVTVQADTLDNIIFSNFNDETLVIKMDIEGAELDALQGAKKSLKNCRKIIVEVHGNNLEQVKNVLENNGFKISVLNDGEFVMGNRF